jgi:hypothetical protein
MKSLLGIALVLLLVSSGAAYGQTGGVTGLVTDSQGSPVAGARVSLWLGSVCQMNVTTDGSGVFNLTSVPVGIYTLKAGKPQTGNAVLEGVGVADGQITDVGVLALAGGGPHGTKGPKTPPPIQPGS